MPKKARYTKRTRVQIPCQHPPIAPHASSPPTNDNWLIPSSRPLSPNGGVSAAAPLRPFRLPQSEPRPETQTANDVQMTELCMKTWTWRRTR
ncbi:uncharacterized protein DS421_12g365290 [Arachis hypogaea]|nr:uncharacterized protein DS421_12g365290 [Arachis hypogaea]